MTQPIFTREPSGAWSPDPVARGPFEGMQGGAAAALMCSQVEAEGWGFVSSFTTHFLKPVPLENLTVTVEPLRRGKRVSVVDAFLSSSKGLCAAGRATLIAGAFNAATPIPPPLRSDPEALPLRLRDAPHGGAWMMDAMEVRGASVGMVWFRPLRPVLERGGAMTSVLPASDWAHGIWPPLGADHPRLAAIPNPDLTVHLFRPPEGAWLGVDAASAWSKDGVGMGWGALYDVQGRIGQIAMSVAVTMLAA